MDEGVRFTGASMEEFFKRLGDAYRDFVVIDEERRQLKSLSNLV